MNFTIRSFYCQIKVTTRQKTGKYVVLDVVGRNRVHADDQSDRLPSWALYWTHWYSHIFKRTLSLCTSYSHMWESRQTAPCIFYFGATRRRNISFKPRLLDPRANSSQNPLNLGEHQSCFRSFKDDKNLSSLPKIEPQFLGRPTLSLVKVIIQDTRFSTTLRQVVKFTFDRFYFRKGLLVDTGQKTT
jgi:hypothetical protein